MELLFEAIKDNNKDEILFLLSCGININEKNDGLTPLLYSIKRKQSDIAMILIDNGVDLNISTDEGESPLYFAILYECYNIVYTLIQKNVIIDQPTLDGNTPLIAACEDGTWQIVDLLIEKGADINHKNKNEITPFIQTCIKNNSIACKKLVERNVDINCKYDNHHILKYIIDNNYIEIVKILADKYLDVKIYEYDPLIYSLLGKKDIIASIFLDAGIDVMGIDDCNNTSLSLACDISNYEIAKILIDKGVSVNKTSNYGTSPLFNACKKDNVKLVNLLLENGADVTQKDDNDVTPLMKAVKKRNLKITKILLDANADPNCVDVEGETTLINACKKGYVEIVEILVQYNANTNHIDKIYFTPLIHAINNGHNDITKILLKHGSDPNYKIADRYSPLMAACEKNNTEIIELFLNIGVDYNISNGNSIMNYLIDNENINIIEKLIDMKYDINSEKLLLYALKNKKPDAAMVFLKNNADVFQIDKDEGTSLLYACKMNEIDIINLIFENMGTFDLCNKIVNYEDCYGDTPLINACAIGNIDIVTKLMIYSPDINHKNSAGNTPLKISCINGNIDLINLLIEKGANIYENILDDTIHTNDDKLIEKLYIQYNFYSDKLLTWAIDEKSYDILKKLVDDVRVNLNMIMDNGDNILIRLLGNIKECDCTTCIDNNASHLNKKLDIINKLIPKVNINHANNYGNTALWILCKLVKEKNILNNNIKLIINSLLNDGANLDIPNNSGISPLMIMCSSKPLKKVLKEIKKELFTENDRFCTDVCIICQNIQINDKYHTCDFNHVYHPKCLREYWDKLKFVNQCLICKNKINITNKFFCPKTN